jgi:hypothetical protein
VDDFAEETRKALRAGAATRTLPPVVDDENESDGDSVFDNWWFHDDD